LASLENGKYGFWFCFGLCCFNDILHLLKAGDHVVASDDLYGGTFRLFDKVIRHNGIEFSFVDMANPDNVSKAIQDKTKMIWIETPTNPMLKLVDIKACSDIGKAKGAHDCCRQHFYEPLLPEASRLGC
jgi:cystathionine gamma-lyase